MIENVDLRVLAGFRCVDAITSLSILDPIEVIGTPLVLRRTLSGVFAVMDAPGVSRSATQSLTPSPASWPAPSNYEITIQDPAQRYLPRRATIAAPQPLPSTVATGTPPVTTPQQVVLYPGPAAPLAPNWAVIRASVTNNATTPSPLPWAVIQITGIAGTTPAGVTNARGEALLAVPGLGLKLSSNSTGAVTETTTPVTVTAWFDPSTLGVAPGWICNPDSILQDLANPRWKSASQQVQLSPGQTSFVKFTISM